MTRAADHMPDLEFPAGWKSDNRLHELLGEAIAEAGCGWLQTACGVGFTLGYGISGHEDVAFRVAVARKICELVMTMARTGEMPGGRLQ